MLNTKKQVIQLVEAMPEDVTLDDIMAELYFKFQVDAGLEALDLGNGIPHGMVKDRMSKWLKK